MVSLKKKYSRAIVPQYEPEYHVLEDAVKVFQEALKIKKTTLILLKRKVEIFGAVCGTSFLNSATNTISCHVYIHRHSTTLGTLILIAHEMVHAWQIDTNRPNKSSWEDEAEDLSLSMVGQLQIKRFPDKSESLVLAEVRMARGWVH